MTIPQSLWTHCHNWANKLPNWHYAYLLSNSASQLQIGQHPGVEVGDSKHLLYACECELKYIWRKGEERSAFFATWWSYSGPFVQTGSTLGHQHYTKNFFFFFVNWTGEKKKTNWYSSEKKRFTLRLLLHTWPTYLLNTCAPGYLFFSAFLYSHKTRLVAWRLRNLDENMEKYEAPSTPSLTFIVFSRFCQC